MTRKLQRSGILVAASAALFFFSTAFAAEKEASSANITVTSSAFSHGGTIPAKHTCEGANVSPALSWTGVPAGAKSITLICDDPDAPAGTWVHWVLYNLPASVSALPEKVETTATISHGAMQGTNDFEKLGYSGPCPPPGKPHRYFFKVYALDTDLALKPGATKKMLVQAKEHHILAEGELMGTCQRKK